MDNNTDNGVFGVVGKIAQRARGIAESAPGAEMVRGKLREAEDQLLIHLRNRINAVDPGAAGAGIKRLEDKRASSNSIAPHSGSIVERAEALMDRSMNQTPESAISDYASQVLSQLVPDEMRILSSVSDGSAIACCDLEARGRLRGSMRIAGLLSRAGNQAGTMLQDTSSFYLGHLLALGLLNVGAADADANQTYEMIENDGAILTMMTHIEKQLKMHPRFIRYSVALSPLGKRFMKVISDSTDTE